MDAAANGASRIARVQPGRCEEAFSSANLTRLGMHTQVPALIIILTAATFSGCVGQEMPVDESTGTAVKRLRSDSIVVDVAEQVRSNFELHVLPSVFPGHGLYEPTIDVADDGTIYYSAHSQDVGRNPAPAYYSRDDGLTWFSMALFQDIQGGPDQQMSAPLFSDEVFIVAADDGTAWGMDCCAQAHAPLVGWCENGAEVCYYNQNVYPSPATVLGAAECTAFPLTDRPWLAYANGKLLLVNNPGGGPLQVGSMDVPPPAPVAYTGTAWGMEWNLCGSSDGYIPGIPDMRDDHFFAVPQLQAYGGCDESHYDVMTGNADDMAAITQTTVFQNTHAPPAEADSTPSNIGMYGQTAFDAGGALYLGAMNNTSISCEDGTRQPAPNDGGLHFALSTDNGASYTETTFRFEQPVSSFYLDGNRYGPGVLLNWGLVDGNHTDWFVGHVFANVDGTLRLENMMLAVDDGPEASRHVQGAALGPDGRAYLALSENSSNPGGSTSTVGDTPLQLVVQIDGPTMPVRA